MRTRRRASGGGGTGDQKETSSSTELTLGNPAPARRQATLGHQALAQGLLPLSAQSPALPVPSTAGRVHTARAFIYIFIYMALQAIYI